MINQFVFEAAKEANVYGKGIDEIVKRVAIGFDTNSYTYYPQQNHEGSVIELTDTSGNVIERYRYDAFGAPTFYTGTWGLRSNTIYDNRFLFTGREYPATYRSTYITPAFNFNEYRARAYNPTLGRFMSEDPKLFDAGDYNLFRYCHNDPVDNVDPTGLDDTAPTYSPRQTSLQQAEDRAYNFIMGLMQRQFSSAISAGMAGYSAYQAWSAPQTNTVSAKLGQGSGHGESRSLAGKNIVATHSDFREQRDPVSATNGSEYNVFIKARHIFYERSPDGTLKSLGAGIPVRETIWMHHEAYLKTPLRIGAC